LADIPLSQRPLPQWFEDAKFGIFIHWGLFSIPAFAPKLGKISDVFKSDYDRAVALTPYTEWYANAIKVPGSPSAEFHRSNYAEQGYSDFRKPFLDGLTRWNPEDWARLFKSAGARYVVLVTKHHDGFCLWPSAVPNPYRENWSSQRDIVGELASAVRAQGLNFGVYYSGGIDWTFNPRPLRTFGDFIASTPGGDYPEYATRQIHELIDRYRPDLLWNDISWPGDLKSLKELLEYYYARVPEGVVNDRWQHQTPVARALKLPLVRWGFDFMAKRHIRKHPQSVDGVIPPAIPYSDFRTPEYASFEAIQIKKWEATRGMSHSFGFNRNDSEEDYASAGALLGGLIDAVSKHGNLLLNVGPRGEDAGIPQAQRERLQKIGAWLEINGAAIYGTHVCSIASGQTDDGVEVRYTRTAKRLFLILLGRPEGETFRIKGFPGEIGSDFNISSLEGNLPVGSRLVDGHLELSLEQALSNELANVLVVTLI